MKKSTVIATAFMMVASPFLKAEMETFMIDPGQNHQTIDGFGASDCWSMCFMGDLDEDTNNAVADLLFSKENNEDGKPKGIGLDIWRFNIGAGSAEQGDDSKINFSTRTECFLQPDGSYDWSKQKGQRLFLKLARERGVKNLLGFLNSPPVYFTENGLATNTGRGGTYNLKSDKYNDLAVFIANVVDSLEVYDGIKLDYISPVNEPDGHWNWQGPKQEGTPATKAEIARLSRLLNKQFEERNIQTKIIIPESSDYRCMMNVHQTDHQRGYEIPSFFCSDSTETYVGDLSHLSKMMAGHSYWTNTPVEAMKDYRLQLRDSLKKYDVEFWQSEVCIMANDEEIGGGHGFDRTMKTALYVARMMHHDLVYANARSWQWWRAIGGNYKDGLLFQYRKNGEKTDTIVDSKLLWIMGNYSRFIKPGAKRIEVSKLMDGEPMADSSTDPYGTMVSSYINPDGSLATVVINYSDSPKNIGLNIRGNSQSKWKAYRTSDTPGEDLQPLSESINISDMTLPPKSVTTITNGD